MACDPITDYLVRETGRYMNDEIFERVFPVSPWMRIIQRDVFPRGMGETINNLTYERNAPSVAEPTWTQIQVSDGAEGGACLPATEQVSVGSTTRSFSIFRRALEGPRFCAEEIRTPFEVQRQLERITDVLAQRTRIEWEIRDRHEYFRNCQYKVVLDGDPASSDDTMTDSYDNVAGAACPTSTLTQGFLNRWYLELIRDGAAMTALSNADGAPILTLITSHETSHDLIRQNTAIRDDFRWADPGELLKPLGVRREYQGFFHLVDPMPRRFTCTDGVFTQVAPYVESNADKGKKYDVNPSWKTAPYEESFIFDPSVFTQRVPEPITNPAPGFNFDPVRYTGTWDIKNIPDEKCNPDGNILYHRGILAAASEPVHPERGVAFIHKRCDPAANQRTSCT